MENATTGGIQSPPFGYLSPPIDGNDASSDDGDHLQTPLTEHDNSHQPYAAFHQNQHHFSHTFFPNDVHQAADAFDNDSSLASPGPERSSHSYASFSSLMTPSPSEKSAHGGHPSTGAFFSHVSPPHALDLANASLEFNPFSSSYHSTFHNSSTFSAGADVYTPTKTTFDFLQNPFESPHPNHLLPDSAAELPSLPYLTLSTSSLDQGGAPSSSLLLSAGQPELYTIEQDGLYMDQGRMYSPRFPAEHTLNPYFVHTYQLGDELGAGGYGFVMTAQHRVDGCEVAVKFIVKDKVPEHAWWDDEVLGRVPTEVMVMSLISHENIVKCLDLFEDDAYFYLVQELHGTPWVSRKKKKAKQFTAPGKLVAHSSSAMSTPALTPSPSTDSNASLPSTPPQIVIDQVEPHVAQSNDENDAKVESALSGPQPEGEAKETKEAEEVHLQCEPPRPSFSRRPSYDLFECIEQSKHKRLSENAARYIFAQVVEAVHYLDSQGITHCDIKDENIVVDSEFKVKLIDFGSAVVTDPYAPRPHYSLFFGTTAYASSEILRKQAYQAPPAEIWTLGVLLSYLLTGHSPFPTEQDAIEGRIVVRERGGSGKLSRSMLSLMSRCLERDPERRADITEVRNHRWLQGALDRQPQEL